MLWPAIATNLLALVAMLVGLRPPAVSGSLLIAAAALSMVTGLDTAALVVPRIIRLQRRPDLATKNSLLRVHWIRTASQSLNGLLVLVMLAAAMH